MKIRLLERLLVCDRPVDDEQLLVGITTLEGMVAADFKIDGHELQLQLEPADALRLALAFKRGAEVAEAQRR